MSLETLGWNFIFMATDPDKAWEVASSFRKTSLPGNVITCETSFLFASLCRNIIRTTVKPASLSRVLNSAEQAYTKVFLDASTEEVPPEMRVVYGNALLSEVAAAALSDYGRQHDLLPLTVPLFVHRIRGDPRMTLEIKPLIEAREQVFRSAFVDLLASAQ